MSLRTKLLGLVLGAAVLPLALAGAWLARSAERSGERVVREQLSASLAELSAAVGSGWVGHRSALLDVAERPRLRRLLEGGPARTRPGDGAAPLEDALGELGPLVASLQVLDLEGGTVMEASASPSGDAGRGVPASTVQIEYGIHDSGGHRLGTLRADVRVDRVLPDTWLAGVGGAVLAVFEQDGDIPLLPLAVEAERFRSSGAERGRDRWLVERRQLTEPPLELALAGPLTPAILPFRQATVRGLWILGGITLLVTAVLVFTTGRMTASLGRLAAAADAVSTGDLDPELETGRRDEIGRVADAFATMTASLRATLARLSQQEAVAELGRFASALAHEIRNPLTAVRLDLQRVRLRLTEASPERRLVERALRQVGRLMGSVTVLTQMARTGSTRAEPCDLAEPLLGALDGARPEFEAARAVLDPPALPGPIPVRGDPDALEHLFLNLLVNAAQALPPGGAARVEIATDASEGDGRRVRVTIRDGGRGISPEILERVFEPGFSGRPGGTGLGLPIARRIARAHGGEVAISPHPAGGTEAVVTLPLARGSMLEGVQGVEGARGVQAPDGRV